MNCLIVDDDEFAQLVVKKCVERTDFLNLVGVCSSAIEAINVIQDHPIDLIFLDIEMPEMTGLEFIESLTNIPQIVLITSKEEYAVEAFEYDVTDYIVKPVEYPRFVKAIEKVKRVSENIQLPETESDHIFIKRDSKMVRVNVDSIFCIEALADYVNIHTDNGRFTILSTMKAMEAKLPQAQFARTHRSFIVRLDRIVSFEENILIVQDKQIPVSRSYKDKLMKRLNFL